MIYATDHGLCYNYVRLGIPIMSLFNTQIMSRFNIQIPITTRKGPPVGSYL